MDQQGQHIVVAVATCRRPRMLGQLLESFSTLRVPDGVAVTFLVIDNAPDAPVEALVETWRPGQPHPVRYVLEREPGIPFARNRGLEEADALGADYLAFIDDDEMVDQDWLTAFVAHLNQQPSHLVGGPVRCLPPADASVIDAFIFRGVRQRYERKERKNARRRARGKDDGITIITNNWLGDVRWLRGNELRFDARLRYSGGSDTALFHAAKRLGAQTSWCPEAVVHETVPRARLSLPYQFRRARDQAATSFWRKSTDERRSLPVNVATAAGKMVFGSVLVVISPVTLGRTLVDGIRLVGYGVGYTLAMAGRRSRHYEVLQGE
ncbi:glycosyltransferase family 2 protein [Bauldia sp.]|uniref:glycosyltransferase family 2 protein n=1 Tax=Bauldia sp. TaxID=2575872 RepID=UPI003BA96971